jgi:hypothetical protein
MKKDTAMDFGALSETDEKRINILIEQYQKQLKAAQNVGVYAPVAPAAGALFDIAI